MRIRYGVAFILFIVIEIIIALYVHDDFIRPYVGDMLVVIVVYCFIRIMIPMKYHLLPLYVFLFAVLVEFSQYFELTKKLGLDSYKILRILFGTVFDVNDILCYAVGTIFLIIYEICLWKKRKSLDY